MEVKPRIINLFRHYLTIFLKCISAMASTYSGCYPQKGKECIKTLPLGSDYVLS